MSIQSPPPPPSSTPPQVERLLREVEISNKLASTLGEIAAAPDLQQALLALAQGALHLLRGDRAIARVFNPVNGERLIRVIVGGDGDVEITPLPGPAIPGSLVAAIQAGAPAVLVDDLWAMDPATYPRLRVSLSCLRPVPWSRMTSKLRRTAGSS